MESKNKTHDQVREYYGKDLSSQADLKTSACCSTTSLPPEVKKATALVHPEILEKSYGCGSPIPEKLQGKTVLDLGCGTGRDCYVLSFLVGEEGKVIGVDMTDEQLEIARKHQEYHRDTFGYDESNVDFRKGFIEDLHSCHISDNSVDIVVSNCVINLAADKEKVFHEIFRVLRPGGELYFSDVFSSCRIPKALQEDKVLYGECLSGALYLEDFRRILTAIDCPDFRVVERAGIGIDDPELREQLQDIEFQSLTVRAFKIAGLEDRLEDYGHRAIYLGSISGREEAFSLDEDHVFLKGEAKRIDGNTALLLSKSRFAESFEIQGDFSKHRGLFQSHIKKNSGLQVVQSSCC